MSKYQFYIPSKDGYKIFLDNFERKKREKEFQWLKKELESLKEFSCEPLNVNEDLVNGRVKEINVNYRTRISGVVCEQIVSYIANDSKFDERLKADDYEVIEKLRYGHQKMGKSKKYDYLSFASKYCYHCNPDKFPIYDSVNVRVLTIFLGYKDARVYKDYVNYFKQFCLFLGVDKLEKGMGFYMDKYIQAIGSSYSPSSGKMSLRDLL